MARPPPANRMLKHQSLQWHFGTQVSVDCADMNKCCTSAGAVCVPETSSRPQ